MIDNKTKYDRSLSHEEKWPDIDKAMDLEFIMKHLNDWCREHEHLKVEGKKAEGRSGLRQELYRVLCERIESVPKDQLVTAVAEMISAELLKQLVKKVVPGEVNDDDDGKEDGFSWLKR